jgi:hypothetical protein
MLAVRIKFDGPTSPNLALGAGGDVAIYTREVPPIHIFFKRFIAGLIAGMEGVSQRRE